MPHHIHDFIFEENSGWICNHCKTVNKYGDLQCQRCNEKKFTAIEPDERELGNIDAINEANYFFDNGYDKLEEAFLSFCEGIAFVQDPDIVKEINEEAGGINFHEGIEEARELLKVIESLIKKRKFKKFN